MRKNWIGFGACMFVVIDAFEKGMGVQTQSVFPENLRWIWLVAGGCAAVVAVDQLVSWTEDRKF